MAKKKQSQPQQSLSPTRFLKERVRLVPVYKCYVSENFEESPFGTVLVVRKHTGEKYTCGLYMIDKYCLGVREATYQLRLDEEDFQGYFDCFDEEYHFQEVSYVEAHNWVWGAVGFAEEAGISPCKEFELAQYVLAEDNDDVELIEYEFGDEDGRHCLIVDDRLEASTYLPAMRDNLGDNFMFTIGPNDGLHGPEDWDFTKNCPLYDETAQYDEAEELDEEDDETDSSLFIDDEVEYHQVHPDYPKQLELMNADLYDVLSNAQTMLKTPEQLDAFLTREGLRQDLEQYILYYIGQSNDTVSGGDYTFYQDLELRKPNLLVALRLLGEVGNEQSLDVVLEGLRQDFNFGVYHFGDYQNEAFAPTLAKLGAHQLDKLMAYAKEPGLDDFAHANVLLALLQIYRQQPERKPEVMQWLSELLTYFKDLMAAGDLDHCSHTLMSWFVDYLTSLDCEELLPLLKEIYEKELVCERICGTFVHVSTSILTNQGLPVVFDLDIHQWFDWYLLNYDDITRPAL